MARLGSSRTASSSSATAFEDLLSNVSAQPKYVCAIADLGFRLIADSHSLTTDELRPVCSMASPRLRPAVTKCGFKSRDFLNAWTASLNLRSFASAVPRLLYAKAGLGSDFTASRNS